MLAAHLEREVGSQRELLLVGGIVNMLTSSLAS